jgi:drug/metabolite transporter (DMT)-like permease
LDRDRLTALLGAYLVTFLWSSSYVLVKVGLTEVSPLTLVTLRYIVASIVLLPIAFVRGETAVLRERSNLMKLLFLGLTGYTVAQGLQCVGLFYLPAVSVTFILNFTPVIVLAMGVVALGERPTRLQLAGMLLVLVGAYLYFNAPLSANSPLGVLITLVSGLGWASYLVAGRLLFVKRGMRPLGLTSFSMGLGTLVLTAALISFEGLSLVSPSSWAIIIWLGVVNTAVAFFLWNHALQRLEAFEISILQNTMLVQIAVLAWIFLGESLTVAKLVPMAMVFVGALVVQMRK